MQQNQKETTLGVIYALMAYGFWGFSPIYFKLVKDIPALDVLGHRVVWSALLLAGLLWLRKRWPELRAIVTSFSELRWLLVSALLISGNWGVYIYTVQSGQILQASLGYYINPLVSVFLGMLFLKETLRPWQWLAVALAAIGTANLAITYGVVPWLALFLAFSFGFYGLVRKMAPAPPMVGLFVETALVAPVALIYLLFLEQQGSGSFGHFGWAMNLLLMAAGLVTTLPLLWFTNGAKRLRLSTMGLFQYIAPTIQFLLAVFVYGEIFTTAHAVTFALIWFALGVYTFDTVRVQRRSWTWRKIEREQPVQPERDAVE